MTENMKKFLEVVSKDEALAAKVGTMKKEELPALAKALGIELTEADFEAPAGELNEDELDTVAGGGVCGCVAYGGGTANRDIDQIPCACVAGGGGEYESAYGGRRMRCSCVYLGGGEDTSDHSA